MSKVNSSNSNTSGIDSDPESNSCYQNSNYDNDKYSKMTCFQRMKNSINKIFKYLKGYFEIIKNFVSSNILILILIMVVIYLRNDISEIKKDISELKKDMSEVKFQLNWEVNLFSKIKNSTIQISFYNITSNSFQFVGHGAVVRRNFEAYLLTALHVLDIHSEDNMTVGKPDSTVFDTHERILIESDSFKEEVKLRNNKILLFLEIGVIIDLVAVELRDWKHDTIEFDSTTFYGENLIGYASKYTSLAFGKILKKNGSSVDVNSMGYEGYSGVPYFNKYGKITSIHSKAEKKYMKDNELSKRLNLRRKECSNFSLINSTMIEEFVNCMDRLSELRSRNPIVEAINLDVFYRGGVNYSNNTNFHSIG